jgi:hypothetical protein
VQRSELVALLLRLPSADAVEAASLIERDRQPGRAAPLSVAERFAC